MNQTNKWAGRDHSEFQPKQNPDGSDNYGDYYYLKDLDSQITAAEAIAVIRLEIDFDEKNDLPQEKEFTLEALLACFAMVKLQASHHSNDLCLDKKVFLNTVKQLKNNCDRFLETYK